MSPLSFVLKIILRNEPNELPGCSTPRIDSRGGVVEKSMQGSVEKAALSEVEGSAGPAPERLHVYALKRFDAQTCRQVAPLSYSRTHMYAPLRHNGRALRDAASHAAAFPSRGLRTGLNEPF
jgi:hypothetical protein